MPETLVSLYVTNPDGAQIPGHGLRQMGEYFELTKEAAAPYLAHPWFTTTAPKKQEPPKAVKSEVQN